MSIYTDMIPITLLCDHPKQGISGASAANYEVVEEIYAAIYKNDSFRSVQSTAYEQSTHNALTFYKGFEEHKKYRFQIGQTLMDVTYFNTSGRITVLLLKEISYG